MKKLLDLFCGAGGAGMGYHRAGFEVVGIDNRFQKHYPFEFHQADALEYLRDHGAEFDVIHASPPCQRFCSFKHMYNAKKYPNLIRPVRKILLALRKPYVIENVPGAPIKNPIVLCGTMFGLQTKAGSQLRRHRLFEIYPFVSIGDLKCIHAKGYSVIGVYGGGQIRMRKILPPTIGVYGGHGRDRRRNMNTQNFSVEDRRDAMGIDWMTGDELSQAIPPAYTEWIGRQLIRILEAE
jgi:DNA (cytosine-5)-methyltransferase 1